jgi:tRNA(fMet)-specific endonuclease VapC
VIRYMLDTSICIELIRGKGAKALARLRTCKVGEVAISSIVLAELQFGVERSARPEQNRIALYGFSAPLDIRPFGDHAAVAYGRVREALERAGLSIGPMDTLIAAHALAEGATLVTHNEREFRRVGGLTVENWL